MRVTEQGRMASQLRYLADAGERLSRTQRQLASGRRLDRASDDPAAAALSLGHRKDIAFEAQMRRNIQSGLSFMSFTEVALGNATDSLQRVRELTVQAASGTLSPQELQATAAEVNQLIEHLAQVANSELGGAYVFSGHRTDAPAYTVTGSPPTAVTFQGDAGQRLVRVSKQDSVAANVTGPAAFGTLFDDLIQLHQQLSSGASSATISANLPLLDASIDRLLAARADLGARVNRLETSARASEETDANLRKLRADLEEIDLPATIVRFQGEQNALEAALGAIGRTAGMTLLDFLR
jgi:flagellar hook-associated protein 3 FlgL